MATEMSNARLRPGFHPARMVRLIREAINRCRLDLSGKVVLTEAATGAYVVTPVIAALAGASKVYAVAKSSRHGSRAEVIRQTRQLAGMADVLSQIQIVNRPSERVLAEADIITNSGHVRPLNAEKIGQLKSSAIITLMYEAWEFRPADVDLAACRSKGIRVVATNEQHPQIDVFGFLGVLALKQLMDAGISVYKSRILLLSDNDFAPYILNALRRAGAAAKIGKNIGNKAEPKACDVILLALKPRKNFGLGAHDIQRLTRLYSGAIIVQFFGDVDRNACRRHGVVVWPIAEPRRGHMGILPSDIGPEATIRLQTGGLKAAEAARRPDCRTMQAYAQEI